MVFNSIYIHTILNDFLTFSFLASSAALSPLSSGMLCCFSKANSIKGCCLFLLKPCGDGDGAVGGVGENDEKAIFGFYFVRIQISRFLKFVCCRRCR